MLFKEKYESNHFLSKKALKKQKAQKGLLI